MRRRLAGEDGVAVVVGISALAVITLISAALASGSVQLSGTSSQDRDAKRALAAADAGLDAAMFRANKLAPSNLNCLTDVPVPPVGGECPPFTQDLGNGASYTYHVTPVLNTTDKCAGLPVQAGTSGSLVVVQRCFTSTGTVNGVSRRVQTRGAAFQGVPLFAVGGMVGLDGVEIGNSSTVAGGIGSNGLIKLGNSGVATRAELGPSAPSPQMGGTSTIGTTVRRSSAEGPFVLAPVDVGNSGTVNDNGRITSGQDASRNVTYNPTTRELTLGNSSTLTLSGGTYNFCKLSATNNAQVSVAVGATVRIFIDSPDRAGSGCAPGTGTLSAVNSITFANASGIAENLQIYVYGTSPSNTIDFKNSMIMNGALYAPSSRVVFWNSASITGGLAAKYLEFKNSVNFTWGNLGELRARTLTLFHRTAWRECRVKRTDPADPESGC